MVEVVLATDVRERIVGFLEALREDIFIEAKIPVEHKPKRKRLTCGKVMIIEVVENYIWVKGKVKTKKLNQTISVVFRDDRGRAMVSKYGTSKNIFWISEFVANFNPVGLLECR